MSLQSRNRFFRGSTTEVMVEPPNGGMVSGNNGFTTVSDNNRFTAEFPMLTGGIFGGSSLNIHPVHLAKPHIVMNLGDKVPVDQVNQITQFVHAYRIRNDVASRISVPRSFGILPFKESLPTYGWGSEMDKMVLM